MEEEKRDAQTSPESTRSKELTPLPSKLDRETMLRESLGFSEKEAEDLNNYLESGEWISWNMFDTAEIIEGHMPTDREKREGAKSDRFQPPTFRVQYTFQKMMEKAIQESLCDGDQNAAIKRLEKMNERMAESGVLDTRYTVEVYMHPDLLEAHARHQAAIKVLSDKIEETLNAENQERSEINDFDPLTIYDEDVVAINDSYRDARKTGDFREFKKLTSKYIGLTLRKDEDYSFDPAEFNTEEFFKYNQDYIAGAMPGIRREGDEGQRYTVSVNHGFTGDNFSIVVSEDEHNGETEEVDLIASALGKVVKNKEMIEGSSAIKKLHGKLSGYAKDKWGEGKSKIISDSWTVEQQIEADAIFDGVMGLYTSPSVDEMERRFMESLDVLQLDRPTEELGEMFDYYIEQMANIDPNEWDLETEEFARTVQDIVNIIGHSMSGDELIEEGAQNAKNTPFGIERRNVVITPASKHEDPTRGNSNTWNDYEIKQALQDRDVMAYLRSRLTSGDAKRLENIMNKYGGRAGGALFSALEPLVAEHLILSGYLNKERNKIAAHKRNYLDNTDAANMASNASKDHSINDEKLRELMEYNKTFFAMAEYDNLVSAKEWDKIMASGISFSVNPDGGHYFFARTSGDRWMNKPLMALEALSLRQYKLLDKTLIALREDEPKVDQPRKRSLFKRRQEAQRSGTEERSYEQRMIELVEQDRELTERFGLTVDQAVRFLHVREARKSGTATIDERLTTKAKKKNDTSTFTESPYNVVSHYLNMEGSVGQTMQYGIPTYHQEIRERADRATIMADNVVLRKRFGRFEVFLQAEEQMLQNARLTQAA